MKCFKKIVSKSKIDTESLAVAALSAVQERVFSDRLESDNLSCTNANTTPLYIFLHLNSLILTRLRENAMPLYQIRWMIWGYEYRVYLHLLIILLAQFLWLFSFYLWFFTFFPSCFWLLWSSCFEIFVRIHNFLTIIQIEILFPSMCLLKMFIDVAWLSRDWLHAIVVYSNPAWGIVYI